MYNLRLKFGQRTKFAENVDEVWICKRYRNGPQPVMVQEGVRSRKRRWGMAEDWGQLSLH